MEKKREEEAEMPERRRTVRYLGPAGFPRFAGISRFDLPITAGRCPGDSPVREDDSVRRLSAGVVAGRYDPPRM